MCLSFLVVFFCLFQGISKRSDLPKKKGMQKRAEVAALDQEEEQVEEEEEEEEEDETRTESGTTLGARYVTETDES